MPHEAEVTSSNLLSSSCVKCQKKKKKVVRSAYILSRHFNSVYKLSTFVTRLQSCNPLDPILNVIASFDIKKYKLCV